MSKKSLYIVSIGIILLIVSVIWPYWNKYLIGSDLQKAALYGTKHSISDTRKFLSKALKERVDFFDPEALSIEKDENNTVKIKFTYQDKIHIFNIVLKELEFTLDVIERDIKPAF